MADNPVVHFEIIANEAEALFEFYGSVFGWKIDADNPMKYGMISADQTGIGGGIGKSPSGESFVTFYISVEDPAAVLASVKKAGGRTLMEPTDIPGGPTIAQFEDPAGSRIGLLKTE